MTARSLVSVIIPVYNGAAYLRETLDSVLAQDYSPIEILAIDDGSTDSSPEILQAYASRITIITQTNQGVANARNAGIARAKGEYITFIDQDDLWTHDKTSAQTAYLEAHPELDYILSRLQLFLQPGITPPAWLKPETLAQSSQGYNLGAMLARRSAFSKAGLLDPRYKQADHISWFFSAQNAKASMHHLPNTVLKKRIHESNASGNLTTGRYEVFSIIKHAIGQYRTGTRNE